MNYSVHDQKTSAIAGEAVEKSGKAGGQREAVYAALRLQPGMTSAEVADFLGADRHMPARRLSELVRAGLVRRGNMKTCRIKGSHCFTWWPTEAPAALPDTKAAKLARMEAKPPQEDQGLFGDIGPQGWFR